jgi:hypothetical protein
MRSHDVVPATCCFRASRWAWVAGSRSVAGGWARGVAEYAEQVVWPDALKVGEEDAAAGIAVNGDRRLGDGDGLKRQARMYSLPGR